MLQGDNADVQPLEHRKQLAAHLLVNWIVSGMLPVRRHASSCGLPRGCHISQELFTISSRTIIARLSRSLAVSAAGDGYTAWAAGWG